MAFQISDLWSKDGQFDPLRAATSAAGAAAIYGALKPDSGIGQFLGMGSNQRPVGYTGGIPEYTIERSLLPDAFATTTPTGEPRRPGSGGRRYFTDTTYTPTGNVMSAATSPVVTTPQGQTQTATQTSGIYNALSEDAVIALLRTLFGGGGLGEGSAAGGSIELARGGLAALPESRGYYLGGTTDGMADEIPATIEGTQPAALSDGEFVIPADVVSHLGNGNSDAGAEKLYAMMDRVRQARTGRKEQGRKINPNKFIPA